MDYFKWELNWVQKKPNVYISPKFYYEALIPYVHDFSFITHICLTADNFLC